MGSTFCSRTCSFCHFLSHWLNSECKLILACLNLPCPRAKPPQLNLCANRNLYHICKYVYKMYCVHNSCIAYMTSHTFIIHSLSFSPLVILHLLLFITYSQVVHNRSSFILLCMYIACLSSTDLFVCHFFYLFIIHSFSIDHSLTLVHLLFIICSAFVCSTSIHWSFIVIHHTSLDVSHKCASDHIHLIMYTQHIFSCTHRFMINVCILYIQCAFITLCV